MNKRKLNIVIKALAEYFGDPYDHRSRSPEILDVLIATKLSQNTTDKSAYVAFTNLKKKFKSWDIVADAEADEIKTCIQVCGLSNTKARDIKTMLQNMKKNYGSLDLSFIRDFNDERIYEEFQQYNGIGIKTISCLMIFALGRDAFPVDTHVYRTLSRLGIVNANTPDKAYEQINDRIPSGKKYELHANLMKFGRNICKSRIPLCNICFLYSICEFEEKVFFKNKSIALKAGNNNFIILENV
ncbi:MAG: endonuclease III [Ignavibacteria bacterium]